MPQSLSKLDRAGTSPTDPFCLRKLRSYREPTIMANRRRGVVSLTCEESADATSGLKFSTIRLTVGFAIGDLGLMAVHFPNFGGTKTPSTATVSWKTLETIPSQDLCTPVIFKDTIQWKRILTNYMIPFK